MRCKWCNEKNKKYVEYHDKEWGILNKREAFEKAYDNFDIDKIINYDDKKIEELINNKDIIRNKLKIKSSINNAKIFKQISEEYKGFYNYLKTFTNY